MCKVLKVNRASYYHWVKSGCIIRKIDKKLNELVEFVFIEGKNSYGTRSPIVFSGWVVVFNILVSVLVNS